LGKEKKKLLKNVDYFDEKEDLRERAKGTKGM
jgi:hypothetical protein